MSAEYAYAPYGEVVAASGAVANPYRLAGAHGYHSDAGTGLVKAGFRYLRPQVGRWTQPDPSGLEANAYLYAAGDPVNRIDPSGGLSLSCTASVLGAWVGSIETAYGFALTVSAIAVGAPISTILVGVMYTALQGYLMYADVHFLAREC